MGNRLVAPEPPLNRGPGTELHNLLAALGVKPDSSCNCAALAAEYDRRGIDWCREHRAEIVARLRAAYRQTDWPTVLRAAATGATSELALPLATAMALHPLRPIAAALERLVEVAIERAELTQPRH